MNIRTRMTVVLLPLVIATVIITGIISFFSARGGMTRVSVSLMSFKAEELKKYVENQWNLLVDYRFVDQPEFVTASQLAIQSYAQSILRSDSELIFAIDEESRPVLISSPVDQEDFDTEELRRLYEQKKLGWVEFQLSDRARIGHGFFFEPFRWYFLVTEESDVFFREVREMTQQTIIALSGAIVAVVLFLWVLSRYLTQPLLRIFSAMNGIIEDGDLSRKVTIEYPDEIGGLADRFNTMTGELSHAYGQVKEYAFREAAARKGLVEREYETLVVLGKAAEYRDPETGAHIDRVGHYSRMLARLLGESEDSQNLIFYASPLHDIGKLGIPDSILLKPDKLTPEEFDIIKQHTIIGSQILEGAKSPYLRSGAVIAMTHHEKINGSGYPNGLEGEEIPLFGRIVGLVDVFDAVTSKRPYKEPWPLERACDILMSEKGREFDPGIVDLFVEHIGEVREIFEKHQED